MNQLFENIKVIDITNIVAGPLCTAIMADYGADVIHVEKPVVGDDNRDFPIRMTEHSSLGFWANNRGKRSVVLDMKDPEGKKLLLEMVKDADVLVESFRPGVMDRLGLGYEDIKKVNPNIIYCSISAFGHTGPYKNLAGYDIIAQAYSGFMHMTGEHDGTPTKTGYLIGDCIGALNAFGSVSSALYYREHTGEGQHVDISLARGLLFCNVTFDRITMGIDNQRSGNHDSGLMPYGMYQGNNGENIIIAVLSAGLWNKFCAACEHPEWRDDPDYATVEARVTNQERLKELINDWVKSYDSVDEVANVLTDAGVPNMKVYTHKDIHQSTEDLIKKVKMLRMISQKTGTCYQRCVGFDAMNATYTVTYEIDQAMGTDYHERFKKFLLYVQENDLMIAGAMTDVKGDRSLRPSQQADPDMFVHVVEKREDGIVIRGAKAHMTGMVNSHEMLIMPTMAMKEGEEDYAVCCALPVDAPGVIHIFGRQTNDDRKEGGDIDQGNAQFGIVGGECLTVLNDVFVPWERVFMCGEYQFSGMLVERFACYHRSNYGGCKTGVSDIVIGAAALMADYSGYGNAGHIKEKLNEMIHKEETLWACSLACSCEGKETCSGAYFVDPLLANVGKHNVTQLIYDIDRLAQDIGGGIIATMPSEEDLKSAEVGKYVDKYLRGVDGVPTEDRIRVGRLIENMTGGTALVESMHGAGSPQAQKVMYSKLSNLEQKKKFAANIAGVKTKN